MPVSSEREQPIEVSIDWLDDGSYSHPYSNLSDNAAGTSRLLQGTLTVQRGRDSARPLGQPMVASGSVTVHNADRLLSPEFAGSPIYQLVEPGRAYRIRMQAGSEIAYDAPIAYDSDDFYDGQAILPLLTGMLEEPQFESGLGAHPTTLSCIGSLSRLRGGDGISTPLYENILTSDALGHLLDAAGWLADDRVISVGDTTLALWWLDNADPFNAMLELLASEGAPAAIYEDGQGRIVFENRNYRTTAARSITARATFADGPTTAILYDAPIAYDEPVYYDAGAQLMHGVIAPYAPSFRDIRNKATYDITRRAQQALSKAWEYGTSLVLGSGESKLITVTLSDPTTGAVAPVAGAVTTVTITGTPTGGTFTVTVNGQTTAGIAYNAIASTVQTALEALSNVAPGDVIVTGGPGPGTPLVCTWSAAFTLGPLTVTASGAGLTGGTTPAATASTAGTDFAVVAGSLASVPTLENVNAQRLGIRFVAGGSGATINGVTSNGPQLRARPWTEVSSETIANDVDASASITKTKGARPLAINGRREINASFALAVCNAAVNYYQINRPVITMPFENVDGAHLAAQLTVEVSDRIAVISDFLGMPAGADFWIEQINHQRQPGKLVTTLVCERVSPVGGGGLWDDGAWDLALWGS